ncbi:unnamed protein product [Calypogeia fissa]
MASAAELRRASFSDPHTDGEDRLCRSLHDSTRKPHQLFHGSRYQPRITRQCVIGFLVIFTVCVLVIAFGIFSYDRAYNVDPGAVSNIVDDYSYRTVSRNETTWSTVKPISDSARLQKGYNADYSAQLNSTVGARILERKREEKLVSSRSCVAVHGINFTLGIVSQAYHSPDIFYRDFVDMACQFKIFIYPHSANDPFANIYRADKKLPTGNYASEHYFKMALLESSMLTEDPDEADLFYMPFSIANMRKDGRIGVIGIKHFVKKYVSDISMNYPYWNRSGGADHFYVNCHSIGKTATYEAVEVRHHAIQVVCSSNYHVHPFFPHKDATIPQVWPRTGFPKQAALIEQRKTLAFFAGAGNSPVRALVAKHWKTDSEIKVYTHKISTPYDQALLTSKYCLHLKGYEVNTARLADAMHYGCVPIIIADYHDLPFNDVLDWSQFSLVVTAADIPQLKDIIKAVSDDQYVEMQKNVMQVRQHFEWHKKPQHFDAFYMVMYELWLRRHVTRFRFWRDE